MTLSWTGVGKDGRVRVQDPLPGPGSEPGPLDPGTRTHTPVWTVGLAKTLLRGGRTVGTGNVSPALLFCLLKNLENRTCGK